MLPRSWAAQPGVSKEEVKTELYFIATPEIIRGSYAEGLIKPPGEKERLQRAER